MRTFITLTVLCAMWLNISAQAPQLMSYQSVIRNEGGSLVTNTPVGMKISILQGSITGKPVYVEIYNPNPATNANGLVTVEIGAGIPVTNHFSSINWANGPYFIKTETDPTGGTNYSISGTSQLLSVPFAFYAAAGPPGLLAAGEGIGNTVYWNGTRWVSNSDFLYNSGVSVGINNANPDKSALLDMASTSKGFLPPRMTTADRDAISSPAQGLLIFNTTTRCLEIWSGASWISLCEGACYPPPTTANAGPDVLALPDTPVSLQGNVPLTGTGIWTILSGVGGNIANPGLPVSSFSGLSGTTYQLQWTITNPCGTSSDQVVVTIGCPQGFANCNGNSSDGCEININTSISNCGACGNVCAFPNATAGCVEGSCMILACNSGFADCDGNMMNGCEANIMTSASHCGSCNTVCAFPNATAACVGGSCTILACNSGFANCDGNIMNGCETNIMTSVSHCGACNLVCAFPNAVAACAGGSCTILSCNTGYANCDGIMANGCETNIKTSVNNCGSCGTVCALPNATSGCINGVCTIITCNAGFANCDGNSANGCETNLMTSVQNCSACGNACPMGKTCVNGICQ